jgi:hypothetical protein
MVGRQMRCHVHRDGVGAARSLWRSGRVATGSAESDAVTRGPSDDDVAATGPHDGFHVTVRTDRERYVAGDDPARGVTGVMSPSRVSAIVAMPIACAAAAASVASCCTASASFRPSPDASTRAR